MNLTEIQDTIERDLRISPSGMVVYLEGKTDPAIMFSLLGLTNPPDGLHQGVLVKGLKEGGARSGSGSKAVIARVELASHFRSSKIIGIVDGDGRTLDKLAPLFDPEYPGPLFHWKAYCIENLVAKTGWPSSWGGEPDWSAEFARYGPYVALNRVGAEVRAILIELGLGKYTNPIQGTPLRGHEEIASILAEGKSRLLAFDVEREYHDELSKFERVVARSLDEAHAQLNGKWLFRHMAPTLTTRGQDLCEYEWLAHARSAGGLPEVRDWWQRVTGNPP